ncbi:hypothetical protein ACVWYQ_006143 [Bradyrhizobium sp. USDA 3397]
MCESSKCTRSNSVMAGLVPAIHALPHGPKNVDARDKPGHDETFREVTKTYRSDKASLAPSAAKPAAKERRSQAMTAGREMTRSRTAAAQKP